MKHTVCIGRSEDKINVTIRKEGVIIRDWDSTKEEPVYTEKEETIWDIWAISAESISKNGKVLAYYDKDHPEPYHKAVAVIEDELDFHVELQECFSKELRRASEDGWWRKPKKLEG